MKGKEDEGRSVHKVESPSRAVASPKANPSREMRRELASEGWWQYRGQPSPNKLFRASLLGIGHLGQIEP